jgi:hypothetical protein
MPPRDPEIPNHRERSALQLINSGNWVIRNDLYPAGNATIASLVRKGWIEKQMVSGGARYRITPAGEAALKAKIPDRPSRR